MELTLHWNINTNFINNEFGKSSKIKMGCKPNSLSQRTVIKVHRSKLDLQFKKMLEAALLANKHNIRKAPASFYFNGVRYTVSCSNFKDCSNTITNIMIRSKRNTNMDKAIEISKPAPIHSTETKW